MKAAASRTSKSHSATVTRSSSFFGAARPTGFFGAAPVRSRTASTIQPKLTVSRPADPLEREADRAAVFVMRKPAEPVQQALPAAAPEPRQQQPTTQVQRFGEGTPTVAAGARTEMMRATTGGQALAPNVRAFMEPRIGAELGNVRVHADESAASLSNHLSARAFTYRNHVFFARGQYQPESDSGRHLLAHELTHTVQQGATIQRTATTGQPAPAVQRAATTTGAAPDVQRWGLDSILEYFADKAAYIPGYRMLSLVLGFDPISRRGVDRTPANFLRALIELVPGGTIVTRVLDSHGVINKAADWVMQKVAALGDIGSSIVAGITRFVASIGWSDALDPGSVWDRAKRIVTEPIDRLISFGVGVVTELLRFVKEAILRPLAELAQRTPGYDLLRAVLGRDPITDEPVPQTADTIIGGFMKLIGQEEIWQNIKRGNAGPRAFAWFRGALAGLMAFVRSIPRRAAQTFASLTFADVVTVVDAFSKVAGAFVGMVGEFGLWAGRQVLSLLEILFSAVAPDAMPYVAKAKAAFRTIVRDPVRFVGNLVRAGRLGFENFAGNILKHLQTALIKWITGPLGEAGVYIPKAFTLLEIVKLVLSVLGLTWQNIRSKLVKIIPDPVLSGLEKTAGVLVTLVKDGPAAAWEQIKGELTELKDQLIGQVTQMIQTEIVKAAVTKLVSMLNPAGAVIQAILAVYTTVRFFVEKAKQIGAVVASFIDSISAIAAGQVAGAAKRVELTLANTLTVVLAFLARFAGLGGVPAKLVGIVKKIRAPIDKALDRIVVWLGKMLEKLVGKAKAVAKKLLAWWRKKVPIKGGGEQHTLTFQGERKAATLIILSSPMDPVAFMRGHAKAAPRTIPQDAKDAAIVTTATHVTSIRASQGTLQQIDDTTGEAASGPAAEQATKASTALDGELQQLATHIGQTLGTWGIKDEPVTGISLPREVVKLDALGKPRRDAKGRVMTKKMVDWTAKQKRAIAAEHIDRGGDPSLVDEKGNLAKEFARRHIVSLRNMSDHYEKQLNASTVSKAKLLLEERGSITGARSVVPAPVDAKSVKVAVTGRWKRFFGYTKNIFIGDSKENSSIQEHLDEGRPDMAAAQLQEHVDRITRGWAFDSTLEITRTKQ